MMTCPNSRWELFEDDELKELLSGILVNSYIHNNLVYDLTKEIDRRKTLNKTKGEIS